jgi:uncharacterized small protein (DUF1192 family)
MSKKEMEKTIAEQVLIIAEQEELISLLRNKIAKLRGKL